MNSELQQADRALRGTGDFLVLRKREDTNRVFKIIFKQTNETGLINLNGERYLNLSVVVLDNILVGSFTSGEINILRMVDAEV